MLFSKSFGYAFRGILFIAARQRKGVSVQADDIATELGVPRFFLAKILKGLAKEGFLASTKGPRGGFSVPEAVLQRPLIELLAATDGLDLFHSCVLRLRACNPDSPCPLHAHFKGIQDCVRSIMTGHTIGSFLSAGHDELLRSLVVDRTISSTESFQVQ